jgi:hypothetical protein
MLSGGSMRARIAVAITLVFCGISFAADTPGSYDDAKALWMPALSNFGIARATRIEVGQPAPALQANTFDGRQVSLVNFKGQVLVINLRATRSGPCRVERLRSIA